ncbi:alpha/beta hydrolase [Streptomyces sp. WMMB303]|uniref:alpha/beta hydrolase n=1 Tax=Streptomyces sp. WMMB303 TaxID=3034154 RepID=UPI0023ED0175|nr:alpha/beta hydrolase [Streptomyces sp. WMMB303]MDF4250496.1 alpha/beta hydrolase [Streptomyces sp. WMMB303]
MKRRRTRALLVAPLVGAVLATTVGVTSGTQQTPVTGPAPGAAAWRADRALGRTLPDPATASPERVAGFFAELSGSEQRRLVRSHAMTVGNLDGVPLRVRYQANRLALKREQRTQSARARAEGLTREDHQEARRKVRRYARLLAPGRQILAFDPRGRGQVAEVFGDLAHATRTAVVVPGSDIDLAGFDRGGGNRYGRPAGMATALHARMVRRAPHTRSAVVAWVGYTTPVGLGPDAATGKLADAGAPRLVRFLKGLAQNGTPAPAVLCHSYGSVVCGRAASRIDRSEAAGLIVFGSPGMRADSVAGLDTPVPVWAARAAEDWIGHVPHVQLLGLGHGTDPADPGFGARVVTASDAGGHSGYLKPGTDSLDNFASIALRAYGAVRCAPTSRECADAAR